MDRTLDVVPLRSLVAVADCGGFQRAAEHLHLSQGGVSQHVRRLEAAIGRPLVVRHGRGSRFTADGEKLVDRARRILALHDETVREFVAPAEPEVLIGSTEHAAARLLPHLSATLKGSAGGPRFRYRIDRGTRLREGLATGQVDLALLLNAGDDGRAVPVGELDLAWYSAAGWRRPPSPDPVPVVAFDSPCELRRRALKVLEGHGIPAVIGAEAHQLAGVQAAVGAELGVALLATFDPVPDGLVVHAGLPAPEPITLWVCPGKETHDSMVQLVVSAIRPLLGGPRLALAQ